jgi:hypothetical protein
VTLGSLYVGYKPNITLAPGAPLEASDPFSTPFTITNNSAYFLRKMRIAFEMNPFAGVNSDLALNLEFKNCGWEAATFDEIPAGTSVTCYFAMGKLFGMTRVDTADISVDVTYKTPWFYPGGDREFHQRYAAYITKEGKICWQPMAPLPRQSGLSQRAEYRSRLDPLAPPKSAG